MHKSIMDSANSLMGSSIYDQRRLEKMFESFDGKDMASELDANVGSVTEDDEDFEGDEDIKLLDDEGGEEGEEEEEIEMISVVDAIRAIQLVRDGDAETPEEAIEMVKAENEEGGGEEDFEGGEDEGGLDFDDLRGNKEEVEEELEIEIGDDEEKEDECSGAKQYGESHISFVDYAKKYLK